MNSSLDNVAKMLMYHKVTEQQIPMTAATILYKSRVVSRRIIETNRYGIFTRDMEAIHIFHIPRLFRPVEV